jgi:arabinogalactan endo-1,4-beta-galactosidase
MLTTYQKDIILVEVAHNWTPTEYKDKAPPFPESPEGQKEFMEEGNVLPVITVFDKYTRH